MPTSNLTVSVIIPTHNRSKLLVRAINSARSQLEAGDEILVIDDGSTDDTCEAVKNIDDQVRYFRLQNGGPSAARNFGMTQAKGNLFAFLDDDDEWFPYKLELQRTLMQRRPDVIFCFSNFSVKYRSGRITPNYVLHWGQREKRWEKIFSESTRFSDLAGLPKGCPDFTAYIGNIYERQMFDDYVLPSTQVVRRCPATADITFPVDLRFCESWAFSSKLARTGPAAYLDIDTIYQNDHEGPRLTGVDIAQQAKSRIKVLERQWGSDEHFLQAHHEVFAERLDAERKLLIRELIASSNATQARTEISRLASPCPAGYRALSLLPDFVLARLNLARQSLKKIMNSNKNIQP